MRVLFAGGSLSSGGIADYSKLLAAALQARGHQTALLSLDATDGPSARNARQAIADFQPDWVSLQFNPFALQARGLLWKRRRGLTDLLRGQRLHIMVHEIWQGIADQRGWKPRLLGRLQKPAIASLLRGLQPSLIHTSNPYYRDLLRDAGLDAGLLPLFGNLPPVPKTPGAERRLLGEGIAAENVFRLGLFSGQRGERLPAELIAEVRDTAAARGKSLGVVSAGRAAGIEALFEDWRRACPDVSFTILGELPEDQLSRFMQAMDTALTHYPYYLCGKSGAAAAWLEHGVPLLTAWGDLTPGAAPVPQDVMPLLRRPGEAIPDFLDRQGLRAPRGHRLPEVADQLLEEMAGAR